MKKFVIVIFLLIIAFCGVVGYICYDFYQSVKRNEAIQASTGIEQKSNLKSQRIVNKK